jgi:hypothetical protein
MYESPIYKNMLQNLHMECWSTFQRMKIPMGSFQVYDALSIIFKLEKPPVEHFEGFILLSKEGDKLQNFFKTLDWKFQLKNSKKFFRWINKS